MARGRFLSKSLSTSERFAALVERAGPLAEFCQVLYTLMMPHTDDFGRLQGDAFTVKHAVHPSSSRTLQEFTRALQLLADVELIQLYAIRSKTYIQVEHFDDHQQGLHKRTRSHYPPPPRANGSGTFPETPGNSGLREEKRREEKKNSSTRTTEVLSNKLAATVPRTRASRQRRQDIPHDANCPHTPRCRRRHECVAKLIADGRKARAS